MEIVAQNGMSLEKAQGTVVQVGEEMFTYWDEGTSRYVFVNDDQTRVVKVEKDRLSGENQKEVDIYLNAPDATKEVMAETWLTPTGLVMQEFVMPVKFAGRKLSMPQIIFSQACRGEVGWKGDRLVCFDLDEYRKY